MTGRAAAAQLDLHRPRTGSAAGRAATSAPAGSPPGCRRPDGSPAMDSGALLTGVEPAARRRRQRPGAAGAGPPARAVRVPAPAAGGDRRRTTRPPPRRCPACSAASPAGAGPARGTPRRSPSTRWPERADDPALDAAVSAVLEVRRMAGVDVELAPPVSRAAARRAGRLRAAGIRRAADVAGALLEVLSARRSARRPVRVLPPRPVHLRPAAVRQRPRRHRDGGAGRRLGRRPQVRPARRAGPGLAARRSPRAGSTSQPREVLRCDSDPNNPEAGRVEVDLGGGS